MNQITHIYFGVIYNGFEESVKWEDFYNRYKEWVVMVYGLG